MPALVDIQPEVREAVRAEISEEELLKLSRAKSERRWRTVRTPLLLLMFGALLLAAYATQDKLTPIVEVIGSIGTLFVMLRAVFDKFGSAGG